MRPRGGLAYFAMLPSLGGIILGTGMMIKGAYAEWDAIYSERINPPIVEKYVSEYRGLQEEHSEADREERKEIKRRMAKLENSRPGPESLKLLATDAEENERQRDEAEKLRWKGLYLIAGCAGIFLGAGAVCEN